MSKLIARIGRRNLVDIITDDGVLLGTQVIETEGSDSKKEFVSDFRKKYGNKLIEGVEVETQTEDTVTGSRKVVVDDDGNPMLRITRVSGFVEDKFIPALCTRIIDADTEDDLQKVYKEALASLDIHGQNQMDQLKKKVGQYRAGLYTGVFRMAKALHTTS